MKKESFVLKGNVFYSNEQKKINCLKNSYIVCIEGISQGVFPMLPEEYKNLKIFDYKDQLIIPGLCDLHIHAPQYAFRGLGMDLELMDWLQNQAFPEESKYSDLSYAKNAYSQFVSGLKNGATTRAVIFATRHKNASLELMRQMEESGLISYVGKVNMDRNAPEPLVEKNATESAQQTLEWLNECLTKFQNTKPILTPRFVPSCTDELFEKLQEIHEKYNLPVQSHLSENPNEISFVKELCPYSKFYGDVYNKFGMFGKSTDKKNVKTVMAHCVYSTDEEINLMKENGVFIAHCPASNLNLASGIAPVKKYLLGGLNIGLGSDVAGGHSPSIFRAMTDSIQVSKMYWRYIDQNFKSLTFDEVFFMATLGGGMFFGNAGSFEKGFEFDALVLDDSVLPHPQELNLHERLERAVYLGLDEKSLSAKFVFGEKIL